MKYAILLKPNSNIPYFEELKRMCCFEAQLMFNKLDIMTKNFEVVGIGKGSYLSFETSKEISEDILKHIPRLSFYYTLFSVMEDGLLKPIDIKEDVFITDDISTRLKYVGKTNEAFTRLLINTAVYSTRFFNEDKINLLDPVCGRGTTLYEALHLGFNAYGVEKNKKSIDDLYTYIIRFLKEGKYKHKAVRGKAIINKENLGETVEIQIGKSKDEIKKNSGLTLKILRGDTTDTHKFYKKNSMHVIAGDLPYGVQHMGKDKESNVRNLDNLLERSIDSWHRVLKPSGALALSWNTYTNKREEIAELLEKGGFEVMNDECYMHFHHRVAQAINRDIIVAIKK